MQAAWSAGASQYLLLKKANTFAFCVRFKANRFALYAPKYAIRFAFRREWKVAHIAIDSN